MPFAQKIERNPSIRRLPEIKIQEVQQTCCDLITEGVDQDTTGQKLGESQIPFELCNGCSSSVRCQQLDTVDTPIVYTTSLKKMTIRQIVH